MTNPHSGDFSQAELAGVDARLSELFEMEVEDNIRYGRKMQLIHELTQTALTVHARLPAERRAAEIPIRTIAAELGAGFRISDRTVQRMMNEADTLLTRFPATHASLAAGRIGRAHVRVIVEAGLQLPDTVARAEFEATVLPVAEREAATRVRQFARVVAERLQPRSLTERHSAAAIERAVRVVDLPDGMAELIATLPGVLAHAGYERLSAMAREAARATAAEGRDAFGQKVGAGPHEDCRDTRSADQLRADILADLLLAGVPEAHIPTGLGAIRANVQVVVPMLTLVGRSDEPATLAGVGPIDAETARRLVGGAKGWDRVLTHPVTGNVLTTDRYRPSEDLKRALQVRDQHCRFPGCRMPVHKCDLDHTTDFARGGKTSECNLAHLCRRHHTLKHESAWTVVQKRGGVLEWTSPTGKVYPDIPTSRVMFKTVSVVPDVTAFEPAPF